MKKRICMILAMALMFVLVGCSGGCAGCTACSKAPKLETVYDRIVELIEASKEVNTVLYGAGLPVYKIGSTYAIQTQLYGDADADTFGLNYEKVTEYAKFHSDTQIKMLAEKVYTPECLAPFYSTCFDGLAFTDSQNSFITSEARFDSGSVDFGQSKNLVNGLKGMRVYEYSSMRIIEPSTQQQFIIMINTWMENTPNQIEEVRLSFVLGQDGQWYLNTFTG